MGTHPIFESDFDCLTESKVKMGDLAEEIDQLQNEISFGEKLDDLDGKEEEEGQIKDDDEDESPKKKNVFERLGGRSKSKRQSSNGEYEEEEEEKNGESRSKRRKSTSMKSAVVDKSDRRSVVTKDDLKKVQIGNDQGKRRATRMFKNLLGTLRTFDETTKAESVTSKRAEIDKKVEEKVANDRKKIIEEKRLLLIKKREK